MITSKFTDKLNVQLSNSQQDKEVRVTVELKHNTDDISAAKGISRSQKMQKMQDQFNTAMHPVSTLLQKKGGKILDQAWVSCSLHIQAPISAIKSLSDLNEVASIDMPHPLQTD